MRILVTGANGFVGRPLAAAYRTQGHQVLAVDVSGSAETGIDACFDLRDGPAVHAAGRTFAPEAIIHAGGISGPMLLLDRPTEILDINCGGTISLLEIARFAECRRFVFCSSTAVYGSTPSSEMIPEEATLRPTSIYAASKVAGEAIVRGYAETYGLDAISLRIGTVYGPGRTTDCVLRELVKCGIAGRSYDVEDGRPVENHIYVDDVVRAIATATFAQNFKHHAYNIVGPEALTLAQAADAVHRAFPGPAPIVRIPEKGATEGPVDGSRAKNEFGFVGTIGLQEGIQRYAEYLLTQSRTIK